MIRLDLTGAAGFGAPPRPALRGESGWGKGLPPGNRSAPDSLRVPLTSPGACHQARRIRLRQQTGLRRTGAGEVKRTECVGLFRVLSGREIFVSKACDWSAEGALMQVFLILIPLSILAACSREPETAEATSKCIAANYSSYDEKNFNQCV